MELSGGMMQRAERVVLVALGSVAAAWCGVDPDQAWLATPILGGAMLLCAVASAATAVSRWLVAYRELARRDAEAAAAGSKPIATPAPAPAPAQPHYAPIPAKLRESAELGL
jgi:hypothetical protein